MSARPLRLEGRKLLVAAVGVATINYVGVACRDRATSGNLPTVQGYDASVNEAGATDAGASNTADADAILGVLQGGGGIDATIPGTVGNLPAPPDAGLGRLRGK